MKTVITEILFLLTISFTFFSLACVQASVETVSSNTVQASQIYQIYTVRTSKTRTESFSEFRVGGATGTTLELAAPANILYNDQPMSISAPSNLVGTNYKVKGTNYRTFLDNFQSTHEFSYTDADGKTYVNSISLAPVEVSAKSAINLETEKPSTIPLSRAIGADETLTFALDVRPDEEIPTAGNTIYFNEKRNAIIITPQYWSANQVRPQFDLQIKIQKSGGISNGTALGGSIWAIYKSAPVVVNVGQAKKVSTDRNTNANTVAKEKIAPTKSPEAEANVEVQKTANQNTTIQNSAKK